MRASYPNSSPELHQGLICEKFVRGQIDFYLQQHLWVITHTQIDRKLQSMIEVFTDLLPLNPRLASITWQWFFLSVSVSFPARRGICSRSISDLGSATEFISSAIHCFGWQRRSRDKVGLHHATLVGESSKMTGQSFKRLPQYQNLVGLLEAGVPQLLRDRTYPGMLPNYRPDDSFSITGVYVACGSRQ